MKTKYYNPPSKPGAISIFFKALLHVIHVWLCLVVFIATLFGLAQISITDDDMSHQDQATTDLRQL